MRQAEVAQIAATWGRPDTRLEVLAATGAILPGLSTEVQALLTEVAAYERHNRMYTALDVQQLGRLWEWIERTGPRDARNGWARAVTG